MMMFIVLFLNSQCYRHAFSKLVLFYFLRFDSELNKVNDIVKQEKSVREKLQREKEELSVELYTREQELRVSVCLSVCLICLSVCLSMMWYLPCSFRPHVSFPFLTYPIQQQ